MSKKIQWPESEPVPQSREEAIQLGWVEYPPVCLDTAKGCGTISFYKEIDDVLLRFEIPFTATLLYGSPSKMEATKHDKRPTRDKLWDVEVESGFLRAKRTIRVLARSAYDACEIACDISHDEFTHWARKPDHKRRKVVSFESLRSDRRRGKART